jgi:hypothetical protein
LPKSTLAFANSGFSAVHEIFDIGPMLPKDNQCACGEQRNQFIMAENGGSDGRTNGGDQAGQR